MQFQPLRVVETAARSAGSPDPAAGPRDLGDLLVAMGHLTAAKLAELRAVEARSDAGLPDILRARGLVTEEVLAEAQAIRHGTDRADIVHRAADPALIDEVGAADCLRRGFLPWRRAGAGVVVATSRPDQFAEIRAMLAPRHGRVFMTVATEADLTLALLKARQSWLIRRAETRVAAAESCRDFRVRRMLPLGLALAALVALGATRAPEVTMAVPTLVAVTMLALMTGLKAVAIWLHLTRGRADVVAADDGVVPLVARQPVVSMLVPLFKEREISERLVRRLEALDYPRELLDICLVVEEDDVTTRATLAAARLPVWMREIVVPRGTLRTKPRALNYALDFARGSIIGVYDAEDAPAPDQIGRIVERFHRRGPEVACLQGILDYYNPRQNWLARCFTIEYATWFRLMLPALERLRLPVPLGGTTLFFRRDALESLGGWDAHNVTEDADLGMRLARHGFRTELVPTVTEEEANCRLAPWVRQRSRWIKGYAVTWRVHMRNPARLWRDLGPRGFFGVQLLFLGTLTQFVLAPLLWSFWLVLLGMPHPLGGMLGHGALVGLAGLFLLSEIVNIAAGMVAVATPRHRWLTPWVPTLALYFPFATIAAWKGVCEIAARPFYWDKTSHGHSPLRPDDRLLFRRRPAD